MNVYWLEQGEADVPAENDWLSVDEAVCVKGMHFSKRRSEWLLGRWTAKRALSVFLNVPAHPVVFKKMDIRPAASGAPEAFFDEQPAAVTISLSHRAGIAACAVAMSGVEMGCDLEIVEPRSDAFVADYFTVEEQALVARASAADRDRLLALLWSAKESALKALHAGLRLDTRWLGSATGELYRRSGFPRLVATHAQHPPNRSCHSAARFANSFSRPVSRFRQCRLLRVRDKCECVGRLYGTLRQPFRFRLCRYRLRLRRQCFSSSTGGEGV